MAKAAPAMYRATTAFMAEVDGVELIARDGELFPAGHKLVKAHPELFSPADAAEQATAAPGETRGR